MERVKRWYYAMPLRREDPLIVSHGVTAASLATFILRSREITVGSGQYENKVYIGYATNYVCSLNPLN
jgi:hypothetical protein